MAYWLDQLRLWIEHIILLFGYSGIAGVMLLENLFPPIPSELIMPFAGFLAARGQLSLFGVIVAGTSGSVVGALVLYGIGAWVGETRLRQFVRCYGRWFLLTEKDFDRASQTFHQYGEVTVFFGRLVPLIRSLVSIPAGINRMPLPRFLLLTMIGSTLWTSALALAGMVLGANWEQVMAFIESYQHVVVIMLVLAGGIFLVLRIRRWREFVSQPSLSGDID